MKISSGHRNLLSIFALCVLAFWGFGSIFNDLNLSISAEISTAAFGALFIILTTKFLMEQESDAKRKQFVYEQNVDQYKEYAKLQMNVLEHGIINKDKINEIKRCHALLLVTGSEGAIKHSNIFVEKSIEASKESNEQQIPDSKRRDLAECTANFLLAARSGLYLPNDHIDAKKQVQLFLQSEENARKLVRQAISVEENKDYKKRSDEGRKITERFYQKIEDWGYHIKTAESEVTVYPTSDFERGTAVIFVRSGRDGFAVKSFFTTQVEAMSHVAKVFHDFSVKTATYTKGGREQMQINFSFENSLLNDEGRLERLRQMVDNLKKLRDETN